jgi:hypothetical protein
MRHLAIATVAAALLALPGLPPPAQAAEFDGNWTVVVTTEQGACEASYKYDVTVAHGDIIYPSYTALSLYGKVSPQGGVSVLIKRFDDTAGGNGHLTAQSGSGTWRGDGKSGTCAGRWVAHRR